MRHFDNAQQALDYALNEIICSLEDDYWLMRGKEFASYTDEDRRTMRDKIDDIRDLHESNHVLVIDNVNMDRLNEQRLELVKIDREPLGEEEADSLDAIQNMLDHWYDQYFHPIKEIK